MGIFFNKNGKLKKQTQAIKGDYVAIFATGTYIFFVNTNIIEQHDMVGVRAAAPRDNDTEKRPENSSPQVTAANKNILIREVQFENLVLNTIRETWIEIFALSQEYVPFSKTDCVTITFKFGRF